MIILGIDPGIAIVGWGVVSSDASGMRQKPVDFGAITTNSSMRTEDRILAVYTELSAIIKKYSPECAAIEELFFNTNQKTGIIVAEARGAIILALRQNDVPIFEYTPLQIKNSVAGYGRADKHQMTDTVTRLLGLREKPKPGRHRRRSRSRNVPRLYRKLAPCRILQQAYDYGGQNRSDGQRKPLGHRKKTFE